MKVEILDIYSLYNAVKGTGLKQGTCITKHTVYLIIE